MAKKEKPVYDSNGRWVEERGRIKGAIRRVFRLSPQMKEALVRARVELPPEPLKDGSPGKKIRVRYRCAGCGELFSSKNVQVDHIETVVPLHRNEESMTIDEIARGIFCKVDNLQVLCSTPQKQLGPGLTSCHRLKTNEENFIRDRICDMAWRDAGLDLCIGILKTEYKEHLKEKEKLREEKEARKQLKLQKKKLTSRI